MRTIILAFIFILFSGSFSNISAEQNVPSLTKEDTIEFLQNAFYAQVSLTEKERSIETMDNILSPYFTKSFREKFFVENVVKGEEGYLVYATDAPINVIPFYRYDLPFEMSTNSDTMLIYQFFPASSEGPVSYDDHYESVYFVKEDAMWKINKIEFTTEEPFLQQESQETDATNEQEKNEQTRDLEIESDKEELVINKSKQDEPTFKEQLNFITQLPFLPSYFTIKYLLFS